MTAEPMSLRLSRAEREVMKLVLEGRSRAEIAGTLAVSEQQVDKCLRAVLQAVAGSMCASLPQEPKLSVG